MDLRGLGEQLFCLIHQSRSNLAVKMRLSVFLRIEGIEDRVCARAFLDRVPSQGAGFVLNER